MSKIVVASFREDENEMFERVIAALGDTVELAVVNTISRLRRKIEPDPQEPTYIQTVQGYGYKLAVQPINKD